MGGEKRTRLFGSIRVRTPSVVCAHGENKTRKGRLLKKNRFVCAQQRKAVRRWCAHTQGKDGTFFLSHAGGVRTRETPDIHARTRMWLAIRYHRFSTAMKAKINTR